MLLRIPVIAMTINSSVSVKPAGHDGRIVPSLLFGRNVFTICRLIVLHLLLLISLLTEL